MAIKIEWEWCKGCGICIERCPLQALDFSKEMNKKGYFPPELKPNNKCNNCKLCELICPDHAIGVILELVEGEAKPGDSKDKKDSEYGCGEEG